MNFSDEFAPGVYRLSAGDGLFRANVYFVLSGETWVIVDTGMRRCAPQIINAAEGLFGAGSRPAAIFVTHSHPDHVGSAADLARAWACPVYLHPDEMPMVGGSTRFFRRHSFLLDRRLILPLLRLAGRRPIDAIVDRGGLREFAFPLDGDALAARASGGAAHVVPFLPDWEAVPTPGHARGHVSFFRRRDRVLLSGDAVVTRPGLVAGLLGKKTGLTGSPWYFTWDRARSRQAVATLAALEPLVLAGGHGAPMIGPDLAGKLQALANKLRALPDQS